MSTSTNANRTLALRFVLLAVVLTGVLVLISLLAGCATVQPTRTVDVPAQVQETEEAPLPEVEEPPASDAMVVHFGETLEYGNGLLVSISIPRVFEPTEWAVGPIKGQESLLFEVTLTNNTGAQLEPGAYSTLSSGGIEAASIIDTGNEEFASQGGIQGSPMTPVLPGKSVTWLEAFSVADAGDITYQLSPGYEYENAIFILPTS